MSVLFRRLSRNVIFNRFSKVAIAASNFMNEFFNGRFWSEFTVSVLKEIIALVRDCVSETRKIRSKTSWKSYRFIYNYKHICVAKAPWYLCALLNEVFKLEEPSNKSFYACELFRKTLRIMLIYNLIFPIHHIRLLESVILEMIAMTGLETTTTTIKRFS